MYYSVQRINESLTHHGILGQKWGKKNGPPYPLGPSDHSASEKKAGYKKSISGGSVSVKKTSNSSSVSIGSKTKKLIDRDFDARKKMDEEWKKTEARLNELERNEMPSEKDYFDKDGRLTDKAKAYVNKIDNEWDKYYEKTDKLMKDEHNERDQLTKDTFFSKEVKPYMEKAKTIRESIDAIYDKTISEDSPLADKAYKEYIKEQKKNGNVEGDLEYGFYHYQWREGNAAYDNALKQYNENKKDLQKQLDTATTEIGKMVMGEFADVKMKQFSSTYAEVGKKEAESLLNSFNWKRYYS